MKKNVVPRTGQFGKANSLGHFFFADLNIFKCFHILFFFNKQFLSRKNTKKKKKQKTKTKQKQNKTPIYHFSLCLL